LIANQSTSGFGTEGSAVPKTGYITEGAQIFEMTDMYGTEIESAIPIRAGEFNITVNGEPGTISTIREF
jgi:hypothetical protein